MYQTIIFDLDGTLLNTLEDLTDSTNYTLKHFQYPQRTQEEVRHFVGNGIARLIRLAVPEGTSEEDFDAALSFFRNYYTSHCQVKTHLYPGIVQLLERLKAQKIHLAIVSNKNDAAVKALTQYYFRDFAESAVGERPGVRKKPAPDSVLAVMEELHAEPGTTLYVGDSEVDHATAESAGVDCCLVSWGFRDRDQLLALHPRFLIDEPLQLLEEINPCTVN